MAIKSFKHKGLEKLFVDDNRSGVNPKHANKLISIMDIIDASHHPQDLKATFHHKFRAKSGSGEGVYSVDVSGNYRVTFQIENDGAVFLDYLDYHGKQIRAR